MSNSQFCLLLAFICGTAQAGTTEGAQFYGFLSLCFFIASLVCWLS